MVRRHFGHQAGSIVRQLLEDQMDAADPRSAALDRDATAHRGASIPVTGGNRGHGGVAKHSGPRGNSWTATGRGCVGCGASSSGTSVPAKGRLKTVDRAGSRDQAIRIGVTATSAETRGGAQYSVDQLVAHLSAEVNYRLGFCGMPCAQRLIRGQYVTVTKTARPCRIAEVPVMSVSRSWRMSLADLRS